MITSKHIYTFEIEQREGHTLITCQQWPWPVLQVVPTPPATFDAIVAQCKERMGFVAHHGSDHTFCLVHLCSGDQKGKYPERHIDINGQDIARRFLDTLRDQMGQAAVWYYTNVIAPAKN